MSPEEGPTQGDAGEPSRGDGAPRAGGPPTGPVPAVSGADPRNQLVGLMSRPLASWAPVRRSTVLLVVAFLGFGALFLLYPPAASTSTPTSTTAPSPLPGILPPASTTTTAPVPTTTRPVATTSTTAPVPTTTTSSTTTTTSSTTTTTSTLASGASTTTTTTRAP